MSRLIDADELERSVMSLGEDAVCDDCAYEFVNLIDAQPAIDAEPVRHGHWKLADIYHEDVYVCSVCHADIAVPINFDYRPTYKYCPMCGAKLDEATT